MKAISVSFFALLFFSCSTNNVTVDDSLQKYFDSAEVKGDFALFDNGQGRFTVYNLPRFRDSAYSPGATFDIVQSLIAIQTGVVKDEKSLRGSFGVGDSVFHGLALRLGKDTLKKWIDSLHYGNRDMGGPLDSFWVDNHLKITADEQLGLIKKLYFGQLPFFRRTQQLVRDMMNVEQNSNYKLYITTGRGFPDGDHRTGWVMGWVEENKHPYFFVLNLESADRFDELEGIGISLVKQLLASLGFLAGKR